jgi:hypothetical protein
MSQLSTGLASVERGEGLRKASKPLLHLTDFCAEYSCTRSAAYLEIKAGRLIATKLGRRTMIQREDAEAWRKALPRLQGSTDDRHGTPR